MRVLCSFFFKVHFGLLVKVEGIARTVWQEKVIVTKVTYAALVYFDAMQFPTYVTYLSLYNFQ